MTDGGGVVVPKNLQLLISGSGGLQKCGQDRCLRYPSLVSRKGLPLNAAISRARMDLHSAWRDVAKTLNMSVTAASRDVVVAS